MNGELQVIERNPKNEVAFGKEAAKALMDIVREQKLSRKFGGDREHIYVEAWQLLGQFAGLAAEVRNAEPIEIDGIKGAKAHVVLVDRNGEQMGGAIAYCMRDEPNWKNKPWFQLASMAQTRAVSKAFRNRLAWIAVLAGYSGTPAEEMDGINPTSTTGSPSKEPPRGSQRLSKPKSDKSIEERRELAGEWLKSKDISIKAAQDYLKKSYGDWDEKDLNVLKDWGKAGFKDEEDIPL